MLKINNRKDIKLIMSVTLALATFGAWNLTEYINSNLAHLEIKSIPNKEIEKTTFDVKSLFPVWVASAKKFQTSTQEDSIAGILGGSGTDSPVTKSSSLSPDKAVPEAPPPAPVEPDYAALIGSRMSLEAVATNGAFVNGKFYHKFEPILDFEYPSHGHSVVPEIVEVRRTSIVIKHGKNITEISM